MRTEQRRTFQGVGHQILVVVVIGLLPGVLTSRGQTYLPDEVGQFANSYSVWLAVSFLLGVLLPHRTGALIGGFAVQVMALFGYYAASLILLDAPPGGIGLILFWTVGGAVGGPVLSMGGYWWKTRRDQYAAIGTALLGAIFVSEGLYLLITLRYPIGVAFIIVGMIATLATAWNIRAWLSRALGLLAVFSAIMYLTYTFVFGFLAAIAANY